MRVKSVQQGTQHAALQGAHADAAGLRCLAGQSRLQPVRELLIHVLVGCGRHRSSGLFTDLGGRMVENGELLSTKKMFRGSFPAASRGTAQQGCSSGVLCR